MNILIVSDNHGLTEELNQIKKRHSVDYMIHCGDSEFNMDDPLLDGFIKVAGNCDLDSRFKNEETLQIADKKIFVTHGHLYGVKTNLLSLAYRAQEEGAQITCYGHTHVAHAEKVNRQILINPGSVRNSKGRLTESYVILNIEEHPSRSQSTLAKVYFYAISGEPIKGESYEFEI